jgi:hypothetical protein
MLAANAAFNTLTRQAILQHDGTPCTSGRTLPDLCNTAAQKCAPGTIYFCSHLRIILSAEGTQ